MTGLDRLLATLDEMELAAAVWSRRSLTLTFDLKKPAARWELRCSGVLESHLGDPHRCGLNVWHEDHAALDQYVEPQVRLRFSRAAEDPEHVIGALWRAHMRVSNDWIDFERYLDRTRPLEELLASSTGGVLAEGPAFLIAAYAKVLAENGCRPRRNVIAKPQAGRATMIHFGESFVVARRITAREL